MVYINFTRRTIGCAALTTLGLLTFGSGVQAAPITLGEAAQFAILSETTATNMGSSVIFGNVGVSSDGGITGFSSAILVGGTLQQNMVASMQAQTDLAAAYDVIASQTPTLNLSGQDLGGRILTAGVYRFDSSAQITGLLTLDAAGDPNARFDFQIGSTLTTASMARVIVVNGGDSNNVYWQVGSSATLGTDTVFQGNILALTSITLTTGATNVNGRALARNGAVTIDRNVVGVTVVPEAGTLTLIAGGIASAFVAGRRRRTVVRRTTMTPM